MATLNNQKKVTRKILKFFPKKIFEIQFINNFSVKIVNITFFQVYIEIKTILINMHNITLLIHLNQSTH